LNHHNSWNYIPILILSKGVLRTCSVRRSCLLLSPWELANCSHARERGQRGAWQGADIIDVKDVGRAFGSATPSLARAIADTLAQRRPISAVVGGPLAHAVAAIADAGASYVKLGLFP
jgi:uncharacterized protein (UPF0264 family)